MPKSMTGYGEGISSGKDRSIRIECRSVNHRYLDISVRLPARYAAFEALIRSLSQEQLGRGRVEIRLTDEPGEDAAHKVALDESLARAFLDALNQLEALTGVSCTGKVSWIANQTGVLTIRDDYENENLMAEQIQEALYGALGELNKARKVEGERLADDLLAKTEELRELVALIARRAPAIPGIYREKLIQRAEELFEEKRPEWYSDQRLFAETALFADRSSIDEEITRLYAHLDALGEALGSDLPVGRQLDFLIQEIFREINTIGSKANDLELTQAVVASKTLLEKIREQVQNIE
ncbi:MAG: YicC family protein [Clostridiaceae bacterium]|nr:YicC family protein [Clostridiaceae bacterium]